MNEIVVAILEKMHQALTHIHEMVPGAGQMGGMLDAIRADIDAAAEALAASDEAKAKKGH